MALNLSALKAKLDKFNRTTGDRSTAMWRPTEGKHVIRIVPFKDNTENPFIELYFHYLGNKTYLSPLTYGNRDPIAEFADSIKAGGSKEDYQQAKPFMPKLRTLVPVIVRGEEDKGVRFFSFGKTVYKQLLEFINDPDVGDITDPKVGRDLVVTYVPQEKSDTNFAKTTVMFKPNQTPLSTDKELVTKFLTEQPNIKDLYSEPSFEELKVALAKYLDPDNSVSVETEEVSEPTTVVAKAAKPTTVSKTVEAAVDEFDELFGDTE